MEADDVARLARHEQRMLDQVVGAGQARGGEGDGVGAYRPLAGRTGSDPGASPVRVREIQSSGTVLIIRFRWAPDREYRDLFLHLDFADYPGTVDGASAQLLDRLHNSLAHDPTWFPDRVFPISAHAALVSVAGTVNPG